MMPFTVRDPTGYNYHVLDQFIDADNSRKVLLASLQTTGIRNKGELFTVGIGHFMASYSYANMLPVDR